MAVVGFGQDDSGGKDLLDSIAHSIFEQDYSEKEWLQLKVAGKLAANPNTFTDDHIFVACPSAREVWNCAGLEIQPGEHKRPWIFGKELNLPSQVHVHVMTVLLWHIWKARNGLIFDKQASSAQDIIRRCITDMDAWSCRYKELRTHLRCWRDYLSSRL
uniref:Uncharacterized protein n=1 Tax=Setaria viridis TaxID=4556 RepID=A0A4U6WDD5_SETVI|nr:hypothetical protein SEVIR_1G263600v2 [Setaria viridis]